MDWRSQIVEALVLEEGAAPAAGITLWVCADASWQVGASPFGSGRASAEPAPRMTDAPAEGIWHMAGVLEVLCLPDPL
ncbi:MAG: hypothetical protein AAGA32_06745 [Pseudomonadota bacterium]